MQEQKTTVQPPKTALTREEFEETLNRKTRRDFEKFKKQLIKENISPNAAYPLTRFDEAAWEEMMLKTKSKEQEEMWPDKTLGEIKCMNLAQWAWQLGSYPFCFFLTTLWVGHHDCAPLGFWREMFASRKANDRSSLMKPKEYGVWLNLPDVVTCYRAHREGETEWIAYTLSLEVAKKFAKDRGVSVVTEYEIPKQAVVCYMNRREEDEIIVPDQTQAQKVNEITL